MIRKEPNIPDNVIQMVTEYFTRKTDFTPDSVREAAELIHSGNYIFSCNALNLTCNGGLSHSSAADKFCDLYETFYSDGGNRFGVERGGTSPSQREHRVMALLFFAELLEQGDLK